MKKYPVKGADARASSLRQNMSEAESRIRQILRSRQMEGYKFRRQVPIGRYIAPTLTLPRLRGREGWGRHEARLIIEIDGGQHDRSLPGEAERSASLQDEGYRILRF